MTNTIWHNPRCSKSREALAFLRDKGYDLTVRLYMKDQPDAAELDALQKLLDQPVIEFTRTNEALFRELGLTKTTGDAELLAAMAEHPKLIERPIIFANGQARVGRPPEKALEIL
jgi:arsenate reductase